MSCNANVFNFRIVIRRHVHSQVHTAMEAGTQEPTITVPYQTKERITVCTKTNRYATNIDYDYLNTGHHCVRHSLNSLNDRARPNSQSMHFVRKSECLSKTEPVRSKKVALGLIRRTPRMMEATRPSSSSECTGWSCSESASPQVTK